MAGSSLAKNSSMKSFSPLPIVLLCFAFMAVMKEADKNHLMSYFHQESPPKLRHFEHHKPNLPEKDKELLELWESMLTGRSAPVARWIKKEYKGLGLNHVFTPSGFHLSAVLLPFNYIFSNTKFHWLILMVFGFLAFSLKGQSALKRVVLIKLSQKKFGQGLGFFLALMADILMGSLNESPLSFCYSLLFLGVIYSGARFLFLWFFVGQCLIAFFSGDQISPLILILSPLLNLGFSLAMPILLLLAYPLWGWQLNLGLLVLSGLESSVHASALLTGHFPFIQIHLGTLCLFFLIYTKKRKALYILLFVLSNSLNPESSKIPAFGVKDFRPQGHIVKIINSVEYDTIYWSDGKCRRDLISGFWWEKCSPRKGSKGQFKKLSSL